MTTLQINEKEAKALDERLERWKALAESGALTGRAPSDALEAFVRFPSVGNALALAMEALAISARSVDYSHLAAQVSKERVDYLLTVYQQGRPVDQDLARVISRQQRNLVDYTGEARAAFKDVLPRQAPPPPEPAHEGQPGETF